MSARRWSWNVRRWLCAIALAALAVSAPAQVPIWTKPPIIDPSSAALTGKVTTYNGVATAGAGVTPVYANVSLTAQTALIGATTLLATGTTPGAGMYELAAYLSSTVSCATPGPAVVGITVTYTDETGAKSAQTLPLAVNGGATLATTMGLGNTTNSASGSTRFWAAASTNIQYATTYVACTTGTGTYAIRIALMQLQ